MSDSGITYISLTWTLKEDESWSLTIISIVRTTSEIVA